MLIILISLLLYSGTQTAVAKYILTDISKKTNHELSIDRLDISLTKGILLNNIFIEDSNNDTLLYANKLKINFNLLNYFTDELNITKLELYNANVKITSNTDSIFNFQYLIDEFSDTNTDTVLKPEKDTTNSEIPINLNNIDIIFNNVNFDFSSITSGIDLHVRNVDLTLNTDSIDITKMKYYANNINIKNAIIGIKLHDTPTSTYIPDSSKLVLNVGANKIDLSNIKFSLKDLTDSMYIYTEVNNGVIYPKLVDIPNQKITAESIFINNAKTIIRFGKKENIDNITNDSTENILRIIPQINWYFACNKINFTNSYFSLDDNFTKDTSKVFDYNHFFASNINAFIKNAKMDNDIIKGDINNLSTITNNNYQLKQFKGKCIIKKDNLKLNNFHLSVNNTNTNGNIDIKYKSFNNFINNNFEIDTANIKISESKFNLSDINYFYKIDTIEYLKNSILNNIFLSSTIIGNKNKLVLKNTNIKSLSNSSLFFNGEISNYTNIDSIRFSSDIELLKTTKDDLLLFINDTINLPNYFIAKGKIFYSNDSIGSKLNIKSEIGESNLTANIIKDKYNFNLELINNDFTNLLDSISIKNANLTANATGRGFSINNYLLLNVVIDKINVNNQTLKNIKIIATGSEHGYNLQLTSNNKDFDLNLESDFLYKDSILIANIKSNINNISLKELGVVNSKNNIAFNINANISVNNDSNLTSNININDFRNIRNNNTSNINYINSSINISDSNSFININSDILQCKINSNYNLIKSKDIFMSIYKNYFAHTDINFTNKDLNFDIKINDKNLVQSNLIEGLKYIDSSPITGNITSTNNEINLSNKINSLTYKDYQLDTFSLKITSIDSLIKYNLNLKKLTLYDSLKVDLLSAKGIISDDTATFIFTNKEKEEIKYNIGVYYSSINDTSLCFGTLPNFIIDTRSFDTDKTNKITLSNNSIKVEHFELKNKKQRIYISPTNAKNDLKVIIENINLNQFSGKYIYKRDLIAGLLNGNIVYNTHGVFSSTLNISDLVIFEEKQGDLNIELNSTKSEKNYKINLKDNSSLINVVGKFVTINEKINPSFNLELKNFDINKFHFFLKDAFRTLEGKLNGNLSYNTNTKNKKLTGKIGFNDVKFKSRLRHSTLFINNQTIKVNNNNLTLNNFDIKDSLNNSFIISGNINNLSLNNYELDLKMDIKDFLIFDIINNEKTPLYGKLILDNKSTITGNKNKIFGEF